MNACLLYIAYRYVCMYGCCGMYACNVCLRDIFMSCLIHGYVMRCMDGWMENADDVCMHGDYDDDVCMMMYVC